MGRWKCLACAAEGKSTGGAFASEPIGLAALSAKTRELLPAALQSSFDAAVLATGGEGSKSKFAQAMSPGTKTFVAVGIATGLIGIAVAGTAVLTTKAAMWSLTDGSRNTTRKSTESTRNLKGCLISWLQSIKHWQTLPSWRIHELTVMLTFADWLSSTLVS